MARFIRFGAYLAFGFISVYANLSFTSWQYWALLATLIAVDVSHAV